jgi:hypothetical protein
MPQKGTLVGPEAERIVHMDLIEATNKKTKIVAS